MTVRVYRSTDSGAPTLSGAIGAFIPILDACLVNGYGSQAAAGWTKPFSGTNLAAYKQGTGSNGFYLRVDNTTTSSSRVIGYETMSDVNTGTGAFPTEAQLSGGEYYLVSNTADSTARPWMVIATEKCFYFWSGYSSAATVGTMATGTCPIMFFGDIKSYKSTDAYHTCLISANGTTTSSHSFGSLQGSISSANTAHYIARSHTQTGTSVAAGKHTDYAKSAGTSTIGANGLSYPDPITGGIVLAPVFIHESATQVTRGEMPGLWCPCHALPGSAGEIFTGNGVLSGKTFILLRVGGGGSSGVCALEISNTW